MKRQKRRGIKSLPNEELRHALEAALRALQSSPRYEFVRLLLAQELLGPKEKRFEGFKELTIEDLIKLGAEKILAIPSLSTARIKLLISILEGLAGEPAHLDSVSSGDPGEEIDLVLPYSEPIEFLPRRSKPLPSKGELPLYSSTETELKLIGLIARLPQAANYDQIKGLALKEFWNPEWPSAPFEQTLTIEQIAKLSVESLLKKRSFSGQKVTAFILALEKCLSIPITEQSMGTTHGHSSAGSLAIDTVQFAWTFEATGLPSYACAALREFESAGHRAKSGNSLLKFAQHIPKILSPSDFWSLWRQEENPEGGPEMRADSNIDSSDEQISSSRDRISKEFSERCPEIHNHWITALSGPGVTLEALVQAYLAHGENNSLQFVLAKIILRALGAAHPSYDSVLITPCWTRAPVSFKRMMDGALLSLPRADAEICSELAALFPFFPMDILLHILRSHAQFDSAAKTWHPAR